MKAPIMGRDKVLYILPEELLNKQLAGRLALQIEHTIDVTNNNNAKVTKDGNLVVTGSQDMSIPFSAVSTRDELNAMLEDAAINKKELVVWEVDLTQPEEGDTGRFKSKMFVGRLDSWSMPATAEGTVDISTTLQVSGGFVEGYFKVSAEDLATIKRVFVDGGTLDEGE